MIQYDDTASETQEYAAFIEKFKPKKTTDDCYTPDNVYEAVKQWAVMAYELEGRRIIRPFWPGADYEMTEYPEGCVVIDNPPFSILSKIVRFYQNRGVDYFLFAPTLTLFGVASGSCNYVVIDEGVTYKNGAKVATSFVTNMGDWKIWLSPELQDAVASANRENKKSGPAKPDYVYPDCVVTAATLKRIIASGIELHIHPSDAHFIRALDAQRKSGKGIYGSGFLISERAAAERAAAEQNSATVWELSDREKEIVARMPE